MKLFNKTGGLELILLHSEELNDLFHNHLTTVEQRSYQIPLGYFRGKSNTNIALTQTALKTDMREKIKQCSVNQSLISLSIFFLFCLPFLFIFFCLFFLQRAPVAFAGQSSATQH